MTDSELRYTFACPSCGGSFSIHIERIPPVRARFSCPKCTKSMDFPSRDEARVYMMLQPGGGTGTGEPVLALQPPPRPPVFPPKPAAPPPPERPPIPALELPPTPAPAPEAAPVTPAPEIREADRRYTVDAIGFEGDTYDRRAIRILIRTKALNESHLIRLGDAAPVRADELPDLKSLFELRKTARFTPPAVCRKHTDQLAHYVCAATGRPLCEACAAERKYGGTSVRVCDHCSGNVNELPVEHS